MYVSRLLAELEAFPEGASFLASPASSLSLAHLPRALRRSLEVHIAKPAVHTVADLLSRAQSVDEVTAILDLVPLTGPPAAPTAPPHPKVAPLPLDATHAEVEAWATEHEVEEELWRSLGELLGLAGADHLEIPAAARRLPVSAALSSAAYARVVPGPVRELARRWIYGAAAATREGLDEEARQAPLRARRPDDPRLVQPWEALTERRDELREFTSPRRLHRSGTSWRVEAEPLAVYVDALGGRPCPTITVPLTPEGDVRIDTSASDQVALDILALSAVDLVLDLLTDPARAAEAEPLRAALSLPQWKRDLAWLDGALRTEPDDDADDDKNLLVWRVDVDRAGAISVGACRAREKKSGTGYVTRAIEVHDVPLALRTDPADERVRDLLSRWRTAPRDTVLQAVRALVGHPRVLPPGKRGDPVPVRLVPFSLHLDVDDAGLMTLHPRLGGELVDTLAFLAAARHNAAAGLYAEARDDGIRVAEIRDATLTFLTNWHHRAPVLPREALPEVLRRLPTWTTHAPLTLAPSLRGAPVEPDPRVLVRLDGRPDGLHVALRVRPLPGGTAEEPGAGAPELYAVQGSRVVHVARDLDAEVHVVTEAAERLGLPETARTQRWEWWLADPQVALAVVAALRERAPTFQVEWSGERPNLRRSARAADLRLTVSAARDWFGLRGGVDVDGVEVGLEQLLEASLDGHRFVQVADGSWVGIEAALSERLAAAGAVPGDARGRQLGPLHAPVIAALAEAGAQVDAPDAWTSLAERAREAQTLEAQVPPGLTAELRPYQAEGFRWLASLAWWAAGACLADDMGLGKTVQAIALLLHRATEGPALVVAPTSVVFNWARELERFAPDLRVVVYHGAGRAGLDDAGPGDVVITTYGVLVREVTDLAAKRFGTVVIDEAQAVKNPESLRAKAVRALDTGFRLALTGTPIENHLGDLWSLFAVVAPGLLGSPSWFRERFVQPIEGQADGRRRSLLGRLVRPFVLRRTKAAVAPDLPDRVEVVHGITLSAPERALYEAARLAAVARLSDESAGQHLQIFTELQRLRQLACHPRLADPGSPVASSKLHHATRLLEDLRASGHKVLVFSSFVRHLDLVAEALEPKGFALCRLQGDTPPERRRAEVDRFQAGQADAFLISLKAGGTGLNLTAATYVIHLDPWWNPASEDQATDRAHRIGQERAVTVYRLVAKGTIEEQIVALHGHKRELADAVLDGTDAGTRASTEELVALLAEASLDPDGAPDVDDAAEVVPAVPPPRPEVSREAPTPEIVAPAPHTDTLAWVEAAASREIEAGRLTAGSAAVYLNGARRLYAASGPMPASAWATWLDAVARGRVEVELTPSTLKLAKTLAGRIRRWLEAQG